jgi:hypothetical protein
MRIPHYCGTERTAHSQYADKGGIVWASRLWPLAHVGGSACTCLGHIDRFVWQPSRCRVAAFDGEAFCAALGRRRLLFVGDSTMQQLASVVMAHVQWAFWPARANRSAACAHRLGYVPSDTLVGRWLGRLNRGSTLNRTLHQSKPDVVVASAGAHIRGEANFRLMLHEAAEVLTQPLARPPTLIWATLTGAGCSEQPLADRRNRTLHAMFHELAEVRGVRTHNWPEFASFDALATEYWPARLPERACVLDLTPLTLRTDARIESPRAETYVDPGGPRVPKRTDAGAWRKTTRTDGYRDCLHFCSPGPLRLVPALLQQRLASGCGAGG